MESQRTKNFNRQKTARSEQLLKNTSGFDHKTLSSTFPKTSSNQPKYHNVICRHLLRTLKGYLQTSADSSSTSAIFQLSANHWSNLLHPSNYCIQCRGLRIIQNTSDFVTIKATSKLDYCQCLINSCLNAEETGGIYQLKNSVYKRNKAKFILLSGN